MSMTLACIIAGALCLTWGCIIVVALMEAWRDGK